MAEQDSGTKSESNVMAQGEDGAVEPVLSRHANSFDFADLTALGSPRFVLTVDTEEEFDWPQPFRAAGHGTRHLQRSHGFRRCATNMASSHAISSIIRLPRTSGVELLGGYANDGRAEIGVQLHPWVNPPFDEAVERSQQLCVQSAARAGACKADHFASSHRRQNWHTARRVSGRAIRSRTADARKYWQIWASQSTARFARVLIIRSKAAPITRTIP